MFQALGGFLKISLSYLTSVSVRA